MVYTPPQASRTPRGLTIIEAVVAVAIVAVIMLAIVGSIIFFYRANRSALEQSFQINNARKGVELLVRDLREATAGDDGSYAVVSVASTSVSFFSDIDSDLTVERISYELSGTTLFRGVLDSSGVPLSYAGAAATSTVSEYVRNLEESEPIFRYYNTDGIEITNYADFQKVRFVSVSLIVNIEPIRAPEEFTLRSSATLRNLR